MGEHKNKPGTRRYSKSNFVDLVELLTPEVYIEEDLNLSGKEINPISEIINTHLIAADNISQVLPVSAVSNSLQNKNLNNISGIAKYFIKQAEQTKINPYTFETNILLPLNQTLSNFNTSA